MQGGLQSKVYFLAAEKNGGEHPRFWLFLRPLHRKLKGVTVETFKPEINEALKMYDKYVVCIDKTPQDFEVSLVSLLKKAMKAYENREPGLRHGIALDSYVTVILSEQNTPRPLCGIYFNLHSPYQKRPSARAARPMARGAEGF